MRTYAVTRHAAVATICMPEGWQLLTQLLSSPLRQDIALYACALLELVANDSTVAGVILREGKAMCSLVQTVANEASQKGLVNTASNVVSALEPAISAESGTLDLIEKIRTFGTPEKGYSNANAPGLITSLRLLQGFASVRPDTCAVIVSCDGINTLIEIMNTVTSILTANEVCSVSGELFYIKWFIYCQMMPSVLLTVH